MNKKENPKSKYISFRVPEDTKIAFKKVADKLGVKVSDLLLEFVEAKILDEGIVKIKVPKKEIDVKEVGIKDVFEAELNEYTENISFIKN